MKLRSNEPFWLVKNGLIHSYPSIDKDYSADILIVGGGITGALMAHQCISEGYKTILIDKREIANGSTSATTSMLQYEIDVPLVDLIALIGEEGAVMSYQACSESIDTLQKISNKIKSTCGFEKKQSLYYATTAKEEKKLYTEYEARLKHGFEVTWLTAKQIQHKYHLQKTHGGILSNQGGSIDAFCLAHDLLQYNVAKGLKVFDKSILNEVKYHKDVVEATVNEDYSIKAKHIIYCTGFETSKMIKDKFVNLLSTFAIVGEATDNFKSAIDETLFWNTAQPYNYMRTTDDGRLLIGGEDEEFVDPAKRDKMLHAKSEKLLKYIAKTLPSYNFKVDFAWAGTFGETKDGLPYIGAHPDFKHSFFSLGFGGNGITFSVIAMEVIAAMLKGKNHPLQPYFKFGR